MSEMKTYQMPMVALRGLVLFPRMILHFDVGREKSINAVENNKYDPSLDLAFKIAKALNVEVDDIFIKQTKSDEENLGFTYAELDIYIRTGKMDDEEKKAKIDLMHKRNLFKLQLMPSFTPKAGI